MYDCCGFTPTLAMYEQFSCIRVEIRSHGNFRYIFTVN